MGFVQPRQDPLVGDVAKTAIGVAGLAMCITLIFRGMRAVMDVGGACADGGPYVSAQGCPEGSTIALLVGMFGLFLFGGVAMWYGVRVGGIWGAAPLLAWSGLFLSLGWNFLDYGLFNPPEGDGPIWGWLIPGVMFIVMGAAPLVVGLSVFGSVRKGSMPGAPRGGQPAVRTFPLVPAPGGGATSTTDSLGTGDTQSLLDRLERLAGLRDRGLLDAADYETAKEAVMRELERRS